MTRFIYDQFAKDYLEELLKEYGEVKAPYQVSAEVREIDVYFSPYSPQNQDLQLLGLLGELARTPAIFEPYRNPVTPEQIGDCLLKLLEVQRVVRKESNENKIKLSEQEIPRLWIITPTASQDILSGFGAKISETSLPGVYDFPRYFRTGIIVIHQLPAIPETLWLRILGRGKVQTKAIDELISLPIEQQFKQKTLELLYNLRRHLELRQTPQDQEVIMRLAPLYQQDRELARFEARFEGEYSLVIRQLNKRFAVINEEFSNQIKQLSLEKVEELGEALLDFNDVDDLQVWLGENQ
ncbi:MAG: DUF4351 domain-containing protein [Sphaerospermopsis sp. SIO1G1]|nr:DUF4351 domain-containing protein [Sphaerospermopsis sp. SIO1G1]